MPDPRIADAQDKAATLLREAEEFAVLLRLLDGGNVPASLLIQNFIDVKAAVGQIETTLKDIRDNP